MTEALRPEEARAVTPLTEAELALYREGLRSAPSLDDMPDPHIPTPGRSLLQITTAEWADRCRRLLATLDAARPDEALTGDTMSQADFDALDDAFGAADNEAPAGTNVWFAEIVDDLHRQGYRLARSIPETRETERESIGPLGPVPEGWHVVRDTGSARLIERDPEAPR